MLLGYFFQATLAYHIAIMNVAPNIALAFCAVVAVGLGRKYVFLMSLIIGYLLELTLQTVSFFNIILYPISAMLAAFAFSDKSKRVLDEEQIFNEKIKIQLPALIRTPLCVLVSIMFFELIHFAYIYLNGVDIEREHYTRILISFAYTTILTIIIQFPLRWFLGLHRVKKAS